MPDRLVRDPPTLAGYGLISTWALFIYFVGPATPLIAEDLSVGPAVAGLTGVVLAAGMIGSGFVGPWLVGLAGRHRTIIFSLIGLIVAAIALALVPGFPGVLVAMFLGALAGLIMANTASAALAQRHGRFGAQALTEGNAIAAWIGLLAPAALGTVVGLGWGWQPAALLIGLTAGIMLLRVIPMGPVDFADSGAADQPEPSREPSADNAPGGLSKGFDQAFYFALLAVAAGAAAEFSLNFWGAKLLTERTDLELASATAALSLLVGGVAAGRTFGARITSRYQASTLMLGSFGMTLVSFTGLFLSGEVWLSLPLLALTGLSLSLLYPVGQSLAIATSGGRPDRATGAVGMTTGLAIGLAPFVLGALAGLAGVLWAFLVVPVTVLVGAAAVVMVRLRTRGDGTAATPAG